MPNNSIIIYRSQQEQFWDQALMSGDAFLYIGYFVGITATVTLIAYLWSKRKPKRYNPYKR
jgi:hypothetical protein